MCKKLVRLVWCGVLILSLGACNSDETLARKIQAQLKIEVRLDPGFSTDECGTKQLRAFYEEFKALPKAERQDFLAELRKRYTQIYLEVTRVTSGYELASYHVAVQSEEGSHGGGSSSSPHYKSEKLIHTELKGKALELNFSSKPADPTRVEILSGHLKVAAQQSVVIDQGYGYVAPEQSTYMKIKDKATLDDAISQGQVTEVRRSYQSKATCGPFASLKTLVP